MTEAGPRDRVASQPSAANGDDRSAPSRPSNSPAARLLVLTLVAALARAVTFGNPIVDVDEEFYYTVAHAMARGAWPYVDIWDRKPFGLFLVYLPAGLFDPPLGTWVYQGLALAAVIATARVVVRIADRAGWRRGALLAGALYIVWLDLADGQGGQAPVFYNLPMVAAAWLAGGASEHMTGRRRRRGVAAMALVGLALQIKYSVVFEGIAFGLWLLWDEWRDRRSATALAGHGSVLVTVAMLPTALVAGGYWLAGHGDDFVYANFLSILGRGADPVAESLTNLATDLLLLSPLVLFAFLGPGIVAPDAAARRRTLFLRCWLGASLFGFLVFGSWFNHYALPVMLPAAAGAAGLFAHRRHGRALGVVALALGFVAGQLALASQPRNRGRPAEFAAVVAAIGRGPGPLYIYQGSTMLHVLTGRPALTRYMFPTHLMLGREQGAVGTDQAREIERIFDRKPEVVVVQLHTDGEDLTKRAVVDRRLARDGYRLYARLPLGSKIMALYRRPAPGLFAPAPAVSQGRMTSAPTPHPARHR